MIKHFFDIVTDVVKLLRVKLHKFLSVAFYYHGLYNYGTILTTTIQHILDVKQPSRVNEFTPRFSCKEFLRFNMQTKIKQFIFLITFLLYNDFIPQIYIHTIKQAHWINSNYLNKYLVKDILLHFIFISNISSS